MEVWFFDILIKALQSNLYRGYLMESISMLIKITVFEFRTILDLEN